MGLRSTATRVLRVTTDDLTPAVTAAAALLAAGGLVAFPTETVYGLGALSSQPTALGRLFQVKGRPADKPLTLHVADTTAARRLAARWSPLADTLAARFWPGPLTLVVPAAPVVPTLVTAGLPTVGLRVPAHPVALALLRVLTDPMAASSANRSSRPSPTTAAHVLTDLAGGIDLLIDGGPTPVGLESTVLDLTGMTPEILRPGAVTSEQLRPVIPNLLTPPRVVRDGAEHTTVEPWRREGGAPPSATKFRHYKPRAPVVLVLGEDTVIAHNMLRELVATARAEGKRPGLLLAMEFGDDWPAPKVVWGSLADPGSLAAGLYNGWRQLDAAGVDLILTHGVEPAGIGSAVGDRLLQAADVVYRPRRKGGGMG